MSCAQDSEPFAVRRWLSAEWRDPRPYDAAGAAQFVEPRRVVFVDARRQDLCFPRGGRRFEAFELRHDVGHRIGTFDSGLRRDALPFEQEAHQVAHFDRLDFLAQPIDGVAVDARQQAPLAPFGLAWRRG